MIFAPSLRFFAGVTVAVAFTGFAAAQATSSPHLERRGVATQLVVDGKPFLMLAGELRNSSSSSLDYMKPLWPKLAAFPMNTVLTPLSWEQTEPVEGEFDFALVDGLITQAREQHLRIVFLWLAAWKNGVSSYPPVWVKQDTKRFPRAVFHGNVSSTLSVMTPESAALREADAKAFAAVMRHIGQVDGKEHTVLMMQVENEVGTLGDTRDHSAEANKDFGAAVPAELTAYLKAHRETLNAELRDLWVAQGAKTAGTWAEVFGSAPRADEIFMAWNYAQYVQSVAAAGKSAYAIPMYVNAWLGGGDDVPGGYPSGGPQPRVIDIWKAAGTALDMYSPDLYKPDFVGWAKQYHRPDNPLFVPETNSGSAGAAWVFYAVGEEGVLGFSPFAIDNALPSGTMTVPAAGDPMSEYIAKMVKGNIELGASYAAIASVAPTVLEAQTKGNVHGFNLTKQQPKATFAMGGYNVEVSLDQIFGHEAEAGCGLVVMTSDDGAGHAEFLGVGKGFRVIVSSRAPGKSIGFGPIDDGRYENGEWVQGRRLNGDETDQGGAWRFDQRSIRTERATTYAY